MPDRDFSNDGVPELTRKEHEGKGLESKRVTVLGYLHGSDAPVRLSATDNNNGTFALLTRPAINYNYLDVQQTSATVETYVFKTGGSGGTTVQTIVITYTDSTKSDIDTVAWS